MFKTTKQNVSLHINNIFREGELTQDSVVKESLTTAGDGKNYRTKYYNLDVIISVGYRNHRDGFLNFYLEKWKAERLELSTPAMRLEEVIELLKTA